jgi:hypothetical protein
VVTKVAKALVVPYRHQLPMTVLFRTSVSAHL